MFPAHQRSFRAAKLLLGAVIFLQACSWALSSSGETCYSRQHRDTNVNVRKALDHPKTIMDVKKKDAERDCILACCSEELKPGIKCNMVVYKPQSQESVENCYLFHCETEQDCPLMSAKTGTNTYDIFKGLTHPSVKVKERIPTMPFAITKQPSTTQSTSTTMKQTTTTTTTQPTTTTSTTQSSTTTTPTPATTSTMAPTELAIILLTMPVEIMPTTTSTKTTTQSTTITTKVSSSTTTRPVQPPQTPPIPVRSSKKQIRPPKKPEPHGKSNAKEAEIPTLQKQATKKTMIPSTATTSTTMTATPSTTTTATPSTTTTATPSTTTTATPSTTTTATSSTTTPATPSTTTTTTPTMTTTTTPTTTTTTTPTTTTTTTTTTTSTTTTERTTIVVIEMENDLKNLDLGPNPPAVASNSDKAKESHLVWKNSLALLVVLTLIILTFVVAVVGRRAMESFDRRHYTRLELNDLHYEI